MFGYHVHVCLSRDLFLFKFCIKEWQDIMQLTQPHVIVIRINKNFTFIRWDQSLVVL